MMLHGGAVRIVNREGFLIETRTVPPPGDNPWWYLPPRPLFWVLGAVFTLQGVSSALFGNRGGFLFWMYLVMGLLGITYIVLLLISLRRDRRRIRSLEHRG
jgi:ABC-type multidrug transport system permease subunit